MRFELVKAGDIAGEARTPLKFDCRENLRRISLPPKYHRGHDLS
jgi:hypothetical protein